MIDLLKTMFSWPNGIVVGNLIASIIWAAPTITHQILMHKKLNTIHNNTKGGNHEA